MKKERGMPNIDYQDPVFNEEEYPGFDLGTKLALWFLAGLLIAMLLGLFGTIIG